MTKMTNGNPKSASGPGKTGSAPGAELTDEEKQDYVEQVEEFEGPNRREVRGTDDEPPAEPGVSRS